MVTSIAFPHSWIIQTGTMVSLGGPLPVAAHQPNCSAGTADRIC